MGATHSTTATLSWEPRCGSISRVNETFITKFRFYIANTPNANAHLSWTNDEYTRWWRLLLCVCVCVIWVEHVLAAMPRWLVSVKRITESQKNKKKQKQEWRNNKSCKQQQGMPVIIFKVNTFVRKENIYIQCSTKKRLLKENINASQLTKLKHRWKAKHSISGKEKKGFHWNECGFLGATEQNRLNWSTPTSTVHLFSASFSDYALF